MPNYKLKSATAVAAIRSVSKLLTLSSSPYVAEENVQANEAI